MLFFAHLKQKGLSWASMSTYRSAIRSVSAAADVPDPWLRYPRLHTLCEGLKKQVSRPVERREG
eukprot:3248172-Rhodomonas_salina.1